MGRVVAIDFGQKRAGIAVTDPLKIIANGLDTVPAAKCIEFLKAYCEKEQVEAFVVGYAKQMDNTDSDSMRYIKPFVGRLQNQFPNIPVHYVDERFTSVMAQRAMIDGGLKKKKRQDKALVDTISATIILQSYLQQQNRF